MVTGLSVVIVTGNLAPMALAIPLAPAGVPGAGAVIAVKSFSGSFVPDQVVAAGGKIWLVGSAGGAGHGTGCRVGRVDPATMDAVTFALPACGMNVAVGPGALFFDTAVADVKSQTYAIHIERFSMSTHTSTVFPAVSATLLLGSDIAHTQLAYADGSLWLYAARNGPEVLRLSPSTGAVEHRYTNVPQIGGYLPLIAATPGYLWLAGGAGSGADFVRLDVGDGTEKTVLLAGDYASVYDMAGVGEQLYFLYLARAKGDKGVALDSFVGRLGANGALLATSPEEQVGTTLVGSPRALYSVGPGPTCTGGLTIWRLDPRSLRTTVLTALAPPGNPCPGEAGERPVALAAGSIFVLYSAGTATAAVLYRVKVG
jgi:hypothetical protein